MIEKNSLLKKLFVFFCLVIPITCTLILSGRSDSDKEKLAYPILIEQPKSTRSYMYYTSLVTDSSDYCYVIGSGDSDRTDSDMGDWYLWKLGDEEYNADGMIKWYDGNGYVDIAYSAAVDSNNNLYVVGVGENLSHPYSYADWFIKKFSPDGAEDTTNWNKMFDGSGNGDMAYSVAIDSNDNA